METKHYKIINFNDFSQDIKDIKNLENYLGDIERIFPHIEKIFGRNWNDGLINIELAERTMYGRPNGAHVIKIKLGDGIIQRKEYPENLWGCLLHETLHAFMNPIIYHRAGKYDLNCGYCKEPFIKSFQSIVYLKLKEAREINEYLLKKFIGELSDFKEFSNSKKVYECYMEMFSKNLNYFSKFIKILDLSDEILIRNNTFGQDLDAIKNSLN